MGNWYKISPLLSSPLMVQLQGKSYVLYGLMFNWLIRNARMFNSKGWVTGKKKKKKKKKYSPTQGKHQSDA